MHELSVVNFTSIVNRFELQTKFATPNLSLAYIPKGHNLWLLLRKLYFSLVFFLPRNSGVGYVFKLKLTSEPTDQSVTMRKRQILDTLRTLAGNSLAVIDDPKDADSLSEKSDMPLTPFSPPSSPLARVRLPSQPRERRQIRSYADFCWLRFALPLDNQSLIRIPSLLQFLDHENTKTRYGLRRYRLTACTLFDWFVALSTGLDLLHSPQGLLGPRASVSLAAAAIKSDSNAKPVKTTINKEATAFFADSNSPQLDFLSSAQNTCNNLSVASVAASSFASSPSLPPAVAPTAPSTFPWSLPQQYETTQELVQPIVELQNEQHQLADLVTLNEAQSVLTSIISAKFVAPESSAHALESDALSTPTKSRRVSQLVSDSKIEVMDVTVSSDIESEDEDDYSVNDLVQYNLSLVAYNFH